jgi:hypothetical protein
MIGPNFMGLSLVPSRSSNLPFRENTDRLPQPYPKSSHNPLSAPTQNLLIKNLTPIGDTGYINVEIGEGFDQRALSNYLQKWSDFRIRNAIVSYFRSAAGKQRKELHAVDLYV